MRVSVYFLAVSLVLEQSGTESISVCTTRVIRHLVMDGPVKKQNGVRQVISIGRENWAQSRRVSEVVWDMSGNERMNVSRKIENRVRNGTVMLNSPQGIRKWWLSGCPHSGLAEG